MLEYKIAGKKKKKKNPTFCRLSVLVCCCAANQYKQIACIFSKFLKDSPSFKG